MIDQRLIWGGGALWKRYSGCFWPQRIGRALWSLWNLLMRRVENLSEGTFHVTSTYHSVTIEWYVHKSVHTHTIHLYSTVIVIEGSLEAKLPTIWRDENAGQLGRSSEMEKVRREKMQVREKVGKSQNTVFFQCFVAPEGRKVGSLKRRVRR